MKHVVGDQWTEEVDSVKHMVKAVVAKDYCLGCLYESNGDCTSDYCLIGKMGDLVVKDLGSVNEDGCLAEERTGKFPFIYHVDSWKDARWMVKLLHEHVLVSVFGDTRQEAIDRWNRRELS